MIYCVLNSVICWIELILLRNFLFFAIDLLLSICLYIAHSIHSRLKFGFCVNKWWLICLHKRIHLKIRVKRLLHLRLWWSLHILREWHHKRWLRKSEREAWKWKINRHWTLIKKVSWLWRRHHLRLLITHILCRLSWCRFFSLL